MAKTGGLLDELITDAKIVAAYGQRSGRLRDYELVSAISAVDDTPNPQWGEPAVVALQGTLNRAMQVISPTTLADLRDKSWKPFTARTGREQLPQLGFVLFSVALLLLTGIATLQYNRGSSLATGIQQLLDERPRSEVTNIVRQLRDAQAADNLYFPLVEQLHTIDDRYTFYEEQVQRFFDENTKVEQYITGVLEWIWGQSQTQKVSAALGTDVDSLAQYVPCPTGGSAGPVEARLTSVALQEPASEPDGTTITTNSLVLGEIFCPLGITRIWYDIAGYSDFAYELKLWLDRWGGLFLPALYGAFGATIYYLRRILDPSLRDPTLTRFVHRVAVGAFAGVIITWFWTPNSQMLTGITSVELTLFTIAFLAGFSVDVLFVLLDRLVTGAMAIAKGADIRPSLAAPIYISTDKADPAAAQPAPATPHVGKVKSNPPR